MSEAGREIAIPTTGQVPALQKGVDKGPQKAPERIADKVAESFVGTASGVVDAERVAKFQAKRQGSKVDLGEMVGKLAPNEGDHEAASGGLGAALIDLAAASTQAVQKLMGKRVVNREQTPLVELEPMDRVDTVAVLREQRAQRLRESQARGGVADRARRAQFQQDRARADGRPQANGQAERRYRANGERTRTVDGGVLRSQRMPGGQMREAGVRSLTDARRAIAAPGRLIEGQTRMIGMAPKGLGQAVTGVVRPMRLAMPMPGPSPLNIAPLQIVNHAPSIVPQRGQGLGQQRGPAMSAMSTMAHGLGVGR